MKKTLIIITALFTITACNNKNKKLAVKYDNREITINEIDNTINKQLFHILEGVYILRRTAANEYINQLILADEAKKRNITVEELINQEVKAKITDSVINTTIKELHGYVPDRMNAFKTYDINTDFGKRYLYKSLISEFTKNFADSLRKNHNIELLLTPPEKLRPSFNTNNLTVKYRNSIKSKLSIILIANYDCEGCKMALPIYNKLYEKYKTIIRFGFLYFSTQVSLSAKAAESAGQQNKFWQMHTKLFQLHKTPDTTKVLALANELKLNITKFNNSLNDSTINNMLQKNINTLEQNGIYGTPTLIINNKIFNAPFNIPEIEDYIKYHS